MSLVLAVDAHFDRSAKAKLQGCLEQERMGGCGEDQTNAGHPITTGLECRFLVLVALFILLLKFCLCCSIPYIVYQYMSSRSDVADGSIA